MCCLRRSVLPAKLHQIVLIVTQKFYLLTRDIQGSGDQGGWRENGRKEDG